MKLKEDKIERDIEILKDGPICKYFKNGVLDEDRKLAERILDNIADESRIWLVTEQKLIGLVQLNNPDLDFPKLGGICPSWNSSEWFDAYRKK